MLLHTYIGKGSGGMSKYEYKGYLKPNKRYQDISFATWASTCSCKCTSLTLFLPLLLDADGFKLVVEPLSGLVGGALSSLLCTSSLFSVLSFKFLLDFAI
jgi:hypothetical protein